MAADLVVNAYPHPLRQTPQQAVVPAGLTLAQIMGNAHERVHIVLDGEYIARDRWADIAPHAGQVIEVRAVPAGGGDDFWRVVGTLLVAAAVFYVPGALALTGWQAAAAGMAVSLAGSLALNALLPPPEAPSMDFDATRRQSITGVRNQMAPYGLMARPYGKMQIYPLVVGKPVTEVSGSDQYLRMLFAVGVGAHRLSDLRIGGTSVSNYSDIEIFTGGTEVDQNYGGVVQAVNPLDLYSRDVDETALNDVVTSNAAQNTVTRTTALDAVEVGVDLTMPGGLIGYYGDEWAIGVMLKIEYSPAGAGTWVNVADYPGVRIRGGIVRLFSTPSGMRFFVSGKTRDTLRAGLTFAVTQGQYDVRITPEGAYRHGGGGIIDHLTNWGHNWSLNLSDVTDFNDLDLRPWNEFTDTRHAISITWTALRAWQPTPPVSADVLGNVVLIGMRIRATDQLNGVVDQFSLVAETKLAAWDGAAWAPPAVSRNPAWAYVEALTGVANPRPIGLSRINTTEIKSWADWCAANGFYYDSRGDQDITVFELIREITAAGRASWAIRDGLYTVVRDTSALTPVQMFTPRNSWGFSAIKAFPQQPHALKVRFINPASDWVDDEAIVYADGYSADGAGGTQVATEFEDLALPGVADYDQAWKIGRYHLAQLILRPETYQIQCDIENLACARGSLVRAAHDVTLWGTGWGRIKSITGNPVTSFTSDEGVGMDGVSTYVVRVRRADGTQVVQQVQTVAGITTALTFTAPVTGIAEGDLFILGIQGQETADLKVIRVEPGADLSATLTLVDAAPDIHNADQGAIPPFQSHITQPLDLPRIRPPVPVVVNVRSDETVLTRDIDGALRVRVVVWYRFLIQVGLPGLRVEMRLRQTNGHDLWRTIGPKNADDGMIAASDVTELAEYEVQLRAVNGELASDWSASSIHTIVGKTTPPPVVDSFLVARLANGDHFIRITYSGRPVDFGHYRMTVDGVTVHERIDADDFVSDAVAIKTPGTYTLGIVAVDVGGYESPAVTQQYTRTRIEDVGYLIAAQSGSTAVLKWPLVADIGRDGYDIRYGAPGSAWENKRPLTQVVKGTNITTADIPPGDWEVGIKAIDTDKNYSLNQAVDGLFMVNRNVAITQAEQHPSWSGTLTGYVRHWTGVLLPSSSKSPLQMTRAELFEQFVPYPVATSTYEAPEIDIDFDDTARIWADIQTRLGAGGAGIANPQLYLDYRTESGIYDGFEQWGIGNREGRYFKFKLVNDNTQGAAIISAFTPVVDNEEEITTMRNITLTAPGPTAIVFPRKYHTPPFVSPIFKGSAARIFSADNVTTSGCQGYLWDASGNPVTGTLDIEITWN